MCSLYAIVLFINLFFMGTKCPMPPSSSCFIEPRNSHCPFSLSYTTITPFPTPLHMQTTHHPPTPHTISTNHTPPTISSYQPLTLRMNVKPQPDTFPIPLNNTHVEPSPLSTLSTPLVAHDQTPQPTPILLTHLQPSCKAFCPTYVSQPHFGRSGRMQFPLPKVETWSPPGLPKTQKTI